MDAMKETDVLRMLLARRENYGVSSIAPVLGRVYSIVMNGEHYNAVVLVNSFDFYEKRYHISQNVPTLVVCHIHDTVLPVPCLSLRVGNFANTYELPESIYDIEAQRRGKIGSQVLLGMYICGLRSAQTLVNSLPPTTRTRYLEKVNRLGKRRRGKPVNKIQQSQSG